MKRKLTYLLIVGFVVAFLAPQLALAEDTEGQSSLEEGAPVRRLLLLRSGRFEIQPLASFSINDPFVRNIGFGAALSYHFNNSLGLGADFAYAPAHMDTDETKTVQQAGYSPRVKTALSVSQLSVAGDLGIIYVPVFGKFSVFGWSANYDLHVFGGAGVLLMDERCADETAACTVNSNLDGAKFAGALGIGTRIYFNNYLALNLELRDFLTSFAEYGRSANEDNAEFQNYFMANVGLSIFLPFDVYISR
ncbi:MAG: hypothetical protein CO108_16745 [Deltaproteobacteria bacterium CG_4_9_14_3_um_filter_63_12]|nr:MAG: hypothetical protein CO108_16745 [Deltaproteobacteria bacterium CG_4_9_14_3_um_filter_63_12]